MGRPKKSKSPSIINVKVNEDEEIEYLICDVNSEDEKSEDEISVEEFELQEIEEEEAEFEEDEDSEILENESMKMEETIVVHVCGKCKESFSDLDELKKHLQLCRDQNVDNMEDTASILSEVDIIDSKNVEAAPKKRRRFLCFCCDEEKISAHNGDIQCTQCQFSFKTHLGLEKHVFSLHSTCPEFPCRSCEVTCPTQGILDLHLQTHKARKPFACKTCGRDFTRKYHLERHLKHTTCIGSAKVKPLLPCNVCGKKFSRTDNLREHLRGHIGKSNRKRDFQCPFCEKSFYGSSLLNIHIRTHTGEKPFPCDVCQKSFSSTGALRKHRRMHTGEKPYKCSICEHKFSAKETLNRHFKIHTGEKPHECNICGKKFIQATQLKSHMFHHTGENGFECEYCKRVFNRKSRLVVHLKFIHQGEKPLECDSCEMTFLNKTDFKRHTKLHKGIKDFQCEVCEKRFSAKSALMSHLLTHTSEEPCVCELCKRKYIRMDCLIRHVRKVHRDSLFEIITEAEQQKMKIIKEGQANEIDMKIVEEDVIYENDDDNDDTVVTPHVNSTKIDKTKQFKQVKPAATKCTTTSKRKREDYEDNLKIYDTPNTIFMDDKTLIKSITELLNLLVDEETLGCLGWPDASVEDVLSAIIKRCGHKPSDYKDCGDYTTKMRENAKLLFTVVIDDNSIKSLLNNHTIDEVILHVLKMANSE